VFRKNFLTEFSYADLLSVLFAVSDRECPATKRNIDDVDGVEITMPFDKCGPGFVVGLLAGTCILAPICF